MANDYTVSVSKNDDATVTLTGTITWEAFLAFESKALARLGQHLELPGFRKGHVPEDVMKKHLGDELVLADMAELAIQEFYPAMLADAKIDAIGRPQLAITKLARGNELGFAITTAVVPDIALPAYRQIAAGVGETAPAPVTEEDVEKVINNLRQMRAYGHVHGEHDHHQHEEPLPEVTDEFAQSFGEFKTVDDLKAKVRENVGKEKVLEAADKRRAAILDAILEKTDVAVPDVILRSEQEKLFAQIEMDVSRTGLSIDDYLSHANKTKDQVLEEFKPEAQKRAKLQLIINAIAKKEQVAATDAEVQERAAALVKMYPGVEQARAEAYADMVITNEKVIDLLEKAK